MNGGRVQFTAAILSLLMVLSLVALGGTAVAAGGGDAGTGTQVYDAVGLSDDPVDRAVGTYQPNATDGDRTLIDDRGDVPAGGAAVHADLENATGTEDVLLVLERREVAATGDALEQELRSYAEASQEPVVQELEAFDGVDVRNQFWIANVVSATVDFDTRDVDDLAGIPGVESVVPNVEFEIPEPPRSGVVTVDTGVDGLDSTGAAFTADREFTYGLEQIDVPGFWETFDTKGEGSSVAIIDDGLDTDHPDIDVAKGAVIDSSGDVVGDEDDIQRNGAHGDHVAGTATGAADPAGDVPTYGVAPESDLLMVDVETEAGLATSAIIGGIEWAVEEDADVASMSLGLSAFDTTYRSIFESPIENANAAGTVVTSSSGNDGDGLAGAPATDFNSIAVGASDEDGDIASFSSGDVVPRSGDGIDGGDQIPETFPHEYVVPDLAAPGDSVLSAGPIGAEQFEDGMYSITQGTSMAAPHVAGAVGLLQSATDEQVSPDEIESALLETAEKPDDIDELRDTRYGTGIINVTAAGLALEDRTTVEGTVTDAETGDPLPGVTVETDSGALAATDENGEYTIAVTTDGAELTIDEWGYAPQSTTVDTIGDDLEVDFALGSDVSDLEVSSPENASEVPDHSVGDVDESGEIDLLDVIDIQRHSIGLEPNRETFNGNLADVDRDGDVGLLDVTLAQQLSLGVAEDKHLTVRSHDGPDSVSPGETVEVTAEIENEGTIGAIEEVEFAMGHGDDLTTLDTAVVDVGGASTDRNVTEVTFEVEIDLVPGEYTYGVVTEDHRSVDTMTVGAETFDATLETAVNVIADHELPYYAAFDGDVTVTAEVINLEEYTAELTDDSDIDADEVTIVIDGDEYDVGETAAFDDYEGDFSVTVDLDADADEDDEFQLEHTFAGHGVEETVTTTPTKLTEEVIPATFELSDFDSPASAAMDDDEVMEMSFNITNLGQEVELAALRWDTERHTPGFASGVPAGEIEMEPGETVRATLTVSVFDTVIDDYWETLTKFDTGTIAENQILVGGLDFGIFFNQHDMVGSDFAWQEPESHFLVDELHGPERVEAGEAADLTATIENIGAEAGETDVDLHVDGETIATESVSVGEFAAGGDYTTDVTFENVELPGEEGEYEWGVSTADDSHDRPIGVGVDTHLATVTVVQYGGDDRDYGEETAEWIEHDLPPVVGELQTLDSAEVDEHVIHETDVFVFHDFDEEYAADIIEAVEADDTTGAVYLEQSYGAGLGAEPSSDSLVHRSNVLDDPQEVHGDFGAAATVTYEIQEDHPIFDGVGEAGDTVVVTDYFDSISASFEGASGDTLAEVDGPQSGPAVAVDPDSDSVMLATTSLTFFQGPGHHEDNSTEIIGNAVEFAEEQRPGPAGLITGVVTDAETGAPVENAVVHAENENETLETTTDEDGVYRFSITENVGYHTVYVADAPEGYTAEDVVSVDYGDEVELDFTVEPEDPTITGTVYDGYTGEPVADAEVYDGDPTTDYFETTTDADGVFEIEVDEIDGLDRGDAVDVRADHEDYFASGPRYVEIGPGENAVDVDVDPIVEGEVSIADQTYENDTDTVAVESAWANVEYVVVLSDDGDTIGASDAIAAGETADNVTIAVNDTIESDTNVTATLHHVDGDGFGAPIEDDVAGGVVTDEGHVEIVAAEGANPTFADRASGLHADGHVVGFVDGPGAAELVP